MAATGGSNPLTVTPQPAVISARRGLPSGRAVAGALLVSSAALGAFFLANRAGGVPDTNYLVITRPVESGALVEFEDVEFAAMQLPAAVAAGAVGSRDAVAGAIALRDLAPGELLLSKDLIGEVGFDGVPIGAVHEIAFAVPQSRISNRVVAGDRVTVLATVVLDGQEATLVAVEDARVLSWDAPDTIAGSQASGTLTLALDDAAGTLKLAHRVSSAELIVVRTTRATDDVYPEAFVAASVPFPDAAAVDDPAVDGPAVDNFPSGALGIRPKPEQALSNPQSGLPYPDGSGS